MCCCYLEWKRTTSQSIFNVAIRSEHNPNYLFHKLIWDILIVSDYKSYLHKIFHSFDLDLDIISDCLMFVLLFIVVQMSFLFVSCRNHKMGDNFRSHNLVFDVLILNSKEFKLNLDKILLKYDLATTLPELF